MTIDLKWALPFVTPYALFYMIKFFWWSIGADGFDPEAIGFVTLLFGFCGGMMSVIAMKREGVKWTIQIGRKP